MNIYEMRIDRFNFDITADYSRYQTFSIGHESCIIKFFRMIKDKRFLHFLQEQKTKGKEIRILTPFVPQSYLETMKKTLYDLLHTPLFHDSMIIINDLGMMHYLHQIEPDRKLCLGRTLVFSFDFTPWGELIYENETDTVQQVIKQVNLLDDIKLNFFKNYHVVAIESNITQNTAPSLDQIATSGLDVYINDSFFLYGIQRSCYIRRISTDNQCDDEKCDAFIKMKLTGQWEDCAVFLNQTVEYFPSMFFLHGNQICGSKRLDSEHSFNHIFSE